MNSDPSGHRCLEAGECSQAPPKNLSKLNTVLQFDELKVLSFVIFYELSGIPLDYINWDVVDAKIWALLNLVSFYAKKINNGDIIFNSSGTIGQWSAYVAWAGHEAGAKDDWSNFVEGWDKNNYDNQFNALEKVATDLYNYGIDPKKRNDDTNQVQGFFKEIFRHVNKVNRTWRTTGSNADPTNGALGFWDAEGGLRECSTCGYVTKTDLTNKDTMQRVANNYPQPTYGLTLGPYEIGPDPWGKTQWTVTVFHY